MIVYDYGTNNKSTASAVLKGRALGDIVMVSQDGDIA